MIVKFKIVDMGVRERTINFPDNSNILDILKAQPALYKSVWHPIENRFYKQVAIQVGCREKPFIDIRNHPFEPLPKEIWLTIVPRGPCTTDWEDPISS